VGGVVARPLGRGGVVARRQQHLAQRALDGRGDALQRLDFRARGLAGHNLVELGIVHPQLPRERKLRPQPARHQMPPQIRPEVVAGHCPPPPSRALPRRPFAAPHSSGFGCPCLLTRCHLKCRMSRT
jgi:hypothetical protein